MKRAVLIGKFVATMLLGTLFLAACGDDDSFSPISKNRGYDYAYTSAKDLSKTPCDSMRKGRDAAIGRDKDIYECIFDEQDSIYLWAGDYDTLTAVGREFHRAESSSSSRHSGLDPESSSSKGDGGSEAAMTSSSYSSSSRYSSSSYSSSSVRSSSSYSSSSGPRPVFSRGSEITLPDSKDDFFNPDIDYGTMTDPRDGKVYRTVDVNGKTWMAENLNFSDSANYPILKQNVFCYNYKEKYCDIMGALYNRAAAMNDERCAFQQSCDLGSDPIQGICPDGWHIPSRFEVRDLIEYVGEKNASAVRSAKGWTGLIGGGTDQYGLSFVGSGSVDGDKFKSAGEYTHAWAYFGMISSQYYFLVQGSENRLHLWEYSTKETFIPVRCIKDNGIVPSSSSESSYSSSSVSSSSVSSSSRELSTPITEKGEQFNPDIDYGTMTDPRDGKTYKTVVVEGKTWMAENLNFVGNEDFPLAEQYSLCPYGEEENCELYGRLYTREAAMNSDTCAYNTYCSLADPLQGVCPAGWHIPSLTEATDLKNLASDSFLTLISAKGWGNDSLSVYSGDDTYGLSFLPAGDKSGNDYKYFGANAFMWANIPGDKQRYFVINASEKKAFIHSGYSVNVLYLSVRCVQDE